MVVPSRGIHAARPRPEPRTRSVPRSRRAGRAVTLPSRGQNAIPARREPARLVNLVNPVQSFPGSCPTRVRNAAPACREPVRSVAVHPRRKLNSPRRTRRTRRTRFHDEKQQVPELVFFVPLCLFLFPRFCFQRFCFSLRDLRVLRGKIVPIGPRTPVGNPQSREGPCPHRRRSQTPHRDCRLPISNCRLKIGDCRFPISNCRLE